MTYPRRRFLKTSAGLTVGSLAASWLPFSPLSAQQRTVPVIAVLWDDVFGTADRRIVSRATLERSFAGKEIRWITTSDTANRLNVQETDLLVMPYGPHFPEDAYPAILQFLRSGGNMLSLGGTPFSIPYRRTQKGYLSGIREVNFHKELGITQSFPYAVREDDVLQPNPVFPSLAPLQRSLRCTRVDTMYYRNADTNDFPQESGTTGTQDAVVTPLVWNVDRKKERRSAPVVQIDHPRGPFAGGRWILVPIEGTITAEGIALLANQAMTGTVHLSARTGYACYRNGEIPTVALHLRVPAGKAETRTDGECRVMIHSLKESVIADRRISWSGSGTLLTAELTLTRKEAERCRPGLYRVTVHQPLRDEFGASITAATASTGFWIHDAELLRSGAQYTTDGDYFLKDGNPYPVAGTTYMTSDVHRKFLFEPNPWLWHQDFAQMKEAGISMVRTGIWTGWRNYMLDPGILNETTMRSLDAFLHTARMFDIPVIFTFFAFLPEMWNGENAYLDPRSLAAQKDFLGLIVRRYHTMKDVMWDLINEPSFCSPSNLWSCRPNYDRHEQQAWNSWLAQRYPAPSAADREQQLRQLYRLRPDESTGLPGMADFSGAAILYDKRPLKTVDYRFFAQEMFAHWSRTMVETIRANTDPAQLITVGQDEAGTGDSPSPHFWGETVDFTSLHNWWLNDDLVWDSVMTKVPGKANLIEETGVMFAEKADGSAFRTEQEAAYLLDRKIAISIGTGGAGFIQWIWNINPLMKNDNEATIGLIRADGTVKPEYDVVRKYARFLAEHRNAFRGRVREEVVMMIPHSQIFSVRNSASEATKRCVRTLTYALGIPVRSVAEHADPEHLRGASLIVVPSPRTLSDHAWKTLTDAAHNGATVMISGIIDHDTYFIDRKRSTALGHPALTAVIAQEEILHVDGSALRFSFRGDRIQQLEKADVSPEQRQETLILPTGKGTIIWSPIPVENSDSADAVKAYYQFCLKRSGTAPRLKSEIKPDSLLVLPQTFERHTLVTLVNESSEDLATPLSPVLTVTVPAQQAVLVLLNTKDGTIAGRTEAP